MKQPGGARPWLSPETVGPGQGRQPRAGWDLELAGDQAEAKLPVAAVPARLPLVSSLASGASWHPSPSSLPVAREIVLGPPRAPALTEDRSGWGPGYQGEGAEREHAPHTHSTQGLA